MNQNGAEVHLKRAFGFIQEVERATESFRQRAIAYDAQMQSDQPFLEGMLSTLKGNKQMRQQKSVLANDLNLAGQEIDQAANADKEATIATKDGTFGVDQLRAIITYMSGQLEMIWGQSKDAKRLFNESLQIAEFPDAHYMLGLLHESDYQPAEALQHFERCLELDPNGEFSVSSVREANAMRNYKKKFRGNWLLFVLLMIFPFPLVFGLLYYYLKRK